MSEPREELPIEVRVVLPIWAVIKAAKVWRNPSLNTNDRYRAEVELRRALDALTAVENER